MQRNVGSTWVFWGVNVLPSGFLRRSCAIAALLTTLIVAGQAAQAATYTWSATAGGPLADGGGNWNPTGGTNWDSAGTFGAWSNSATDTAIFGVGSGTAGTVTVGSVNAGAIIFNAPGSGNYTLSSGTITLGGTTPTITVSNSAATIGSLLAGTAGLTKTGASALTLTGSNTYTGTTTVSQGALILSSASGAAIPGNLAIFGGASNTGNVWATANNQLGASTVISSVNATGVASFTLLGTTQTAAGLSSPSGGLMVANDTTTSGTPSPSNAGSAILNLTGSGSYTDGGWVWNNWGGGGTLNLNVAMTGTGNQTLSGNQITYTGSTNITSGQLILSNATAYNSPTTIGSGTILTWGGNANNTDNNTQAITLSSGGTMQNANTAGYWVLGFPVTASGSTTINMAMPATGSSGQGFYFSGGLKGSGTCTINVPNAGNGVNLWTANSTFAGTLIVNGIASTTPFVGSGLGVGGASAGLENADITLNGTMELGSGGFGWANTNNGSFTMGALSGTGDVVSNGSTSTVTLGYTNNNGNFSGAIANGTGTLTLVKTGSGMQILTGSNTYTGSTTVSNGTLSVSGGGSINGTLSAIAQSGGVLNISNGVVTLASNSSGIFGVGYGANGTGTVTVGSGTLNVGTGGDITFIGGGASGGPYGTGVLNVNAGGLVNFAAPGAFPAERIYFGGYGGTGIMNVNGGTISTARDIWGQTAGTVSLNGAYLQAAAGYSSKGGAGGGAGSGFLAGSLTVNVLSGGVTVDSNGNNITIADSLLNGGGGGGLTKVGSGTLTITAPSTYAGPTSLNAGTLSYNVGNPAAAYPPGTLTVNNGTTLSFGANSFYQLGGWSGGTGTTPVVVNAGGVLQTSVSGGICALNNLTLAGGTVDATGGWTSGNNWGALDLFGTLSVTANSSIVNVMGIDNFISPGGQNGNQILTINVSPGATLTENLPFEDYGTNVTDTYAITQTGSGTLLLTGSSTYSGATTISGGTMQIAGGGVLGNGNYSASIVNNSALVFASSSNQTLGGVISGSGSLTQAGNSTLTLTVANSFSGALTINAGAVKLPGGNNNSYLTGNPNIYVNSGGTLEFSNYNSLAVTTGATPTVTVNGGTILSSPLETFNNLTLNSGTVSVNDNDGYGGTWGSLAFGKTLTATGNSAINLLSGFTGTIQNANNGNGGGGFQTFTVLTPAASDSLTITPAIESSLGLVKLGSGLLTLSASETYTGATTISGGTLTLQDTTSTFGSPFPSAVAVNAGTTLVAVRTALGYANRSVILGNGITGSGVIDINNAGSGINGGWTEVSGGSGSMNFSGTININSGVFGRDNTNANSIIGTATVNVAAGAVFGAGRGGNSTIGALNGAGDVSSLWLGTNQGSITIGNGGGSGTFSGILHGNGTNGTDGTIEGGILSVIKTGSGTETLTGVNTFTGATTVNGGLLSITGGGVIPATNTIITQTGGSMSIVNGSVSMSSGGGFGDGYGATGTGTVVVGSGGTLNVGTGGGLVFIGGGPNGGTAGTGTLTITASGLVNVGAAGAFPNDQIYLAGYGGAGTINLNGGVLSTARQIATGGSSVLNFNGGTLQAAASLSNLINVISQANVLSGGATIDTQGYTDTISQALLSGESPDGGLTKIGSGTLTLSASNTYNGGTTINNGMLIAGNNAALGSGTLTLNGGTLGANNVTIANNIVAANGITSGIYFTGNNSVTLSGNLVGSGTVNFSTGATAQIIPILPNVSAFTGTIGIDTSAAGNIFFPSVSSGASANWVITGGGTASGAASGSFLFTGGTAVSLGALSGNGRVGAANANTIWSVGALNTNTTFSGVIIDNYFSGTAALNKVGTGMLTLSGPNAYSGGTTISAGSIQVGSGGAAGTLGSGPVVNNSILSFNRSDTGLVVSNVISGSGAVFQNGSGTTTLASANSYSGGTTINAGVLLASNVAAMGSGSVTVNGGALGVTNGAVLSNNIALNGGSLFASGSGALAGNITGASGLTKIGGGVLTLSGTNTYSGPTVISAGTLRLAGATVWPANMNIMPVGDSITYGTNGTNAGYRGFLYSDLTVGGDSSFQLVGTTNGNPGSLPTSPVNQTYHDGWPGWTSTQINTNMGSWLTSLSGSGQTPSVITLMIGTNDPGNGYTVSNTTANIASIISTAYTDDPGVKFLLGTITPRTDNSSYNAANLTVNADMASIVAQDQASGDNISLVDLNTNFPSNGLSSDNLHPNDTGYAWMASQWYNALAAGATSLPATSALPLNTPTTVNPGATLDLASNAATIGPLTGAGSVLMGSSGGLTVNSTSASTFSGSISGGAAFTKTGTATLMLAGANAYTGPTYINTGSLAVGPGGSLASSSVNIASGAFFDVTAAPGGYTVPSGQTVTGSGTVSVAPGTSFTVGGGGAVSGPSSGTGALTVNGGTLVLNTGSTLSFSASSPGVNSLINVTGTLDLAGSSVAVSLYQAGTNSLYTSSGSFTVMTYGSLIGSTSSLLAYSPVDLSESYSFNASAGSLTLDVATTPVWSGSAGANWSTAANWSNSAAPVNGQALIFAGSNTTNTNDLNGLQAAGLQFSANAASFALSGSGIQLSNALNNFSANAQTIGMSVQLGSNLAVNTPAGAVTFTAAISDGGAGYGITKSGSGALILLANNTFSGATTVSAGTLQLGNGSTNGSLAGNLVDNATVVFQPATAATIAAISGNGTIAQMGPGITVLYGTNQFAGSVAVSGGTLDVASVGSLTSSGGFTVTAGALNADGYINATSGQLTIGSGASVNVNSIGTFSSSGAVSIAGGALNVSGAFVNSGAGLISVSGGGVFNLSGAGTINGTSNELLVGNATAGTLNMTGGSLTINDSGVSSASPTSLAGLRVGNAGGTGALNISGGALTLGTSDEFLVGYDNGIGNVTVSNGTLNLGSGGRVFLGGNDNGNGQNSGVGTVTVNSGGLLAIGTPGAFPNERVYLGGYNGTGIINVSGGTISSARDIWGQTAGTVSLNGAYLQAATGYSSKGGNAGGAGGGFLAGSLTVKVLAGGVTVDSNGNNITIADSLLNGGGGGGLTKVGSGTLALTAANTFTGPLTINAGTVTLPGGNGSNFLSGNPNVVVNSGGTLSFSGYNSFGTNTNSMSPVTVNQGTILSSLSTSTSNYTILFNNLTLNSGTASIYGNDLYTNWGTFGFAGITTATGNSMVNVIAGTGTIGNSSGFSPTFTVLTPAASDSLTVSAVIQNDYQTESLVKQGSGLMTLSASNLYTGGTTISGGTLQLGTGQAGQNGSITGANGVTDNATLLYNLAGSQTISYAIGGSGAVVKSGSNLLNLAVSDGYSGGTVVQNGTLQLGNAAALGTGALAANGGTLDLNGFGVTVGSFSGAAGIVTNTSPSTTASFNVTQTAPGTFSGQINDGAGAVAFNLNGSSVLTLANTNAYSAGTTVSGGTLRMGAANALPYGANAANVTVNGVLDLAGQSTNVNGLWGAGTVNNSGGNGTLIVGNNNATSTFSGVLQNSAGTLGLTKTGTGSLTLASANNYAGPTTVQNGVLYLSTGLAGPAVVTGGTLDATAAPQSIYSMNVGIAGTLNLAVGSLISSAGSDAFAGTLNLTGDTGAAVLMTYAGETGQFITPVNGLAPGFVLSYGATDLAIVTSYNGPPTWQYANSGSWNTPANWAGGVPNGIGQTAVVGAATNTSWTITLDSPQTLGTLTFTNSSGNTSAGYTLSAGSAGTLTLDNTASTAQIIVNGGSHAITAPLYLSNGTLEVTAGSSGILTISGSISDGGTGASLLVDGDGTGELVLSGTNTFGGPTAVATVSSGTLVLMSNEALADGTSLTVGNASAFGGIQAAGASEATLGKSGLQISPVPEPGTLVLVTAILAGAAACRRRNRRRL